MTFKIKMFYLVIHVYGLSKAKCKVQMRLERAKQIKNTPASKNCSYHRDKTHYQKKIKKFVIRIQYNGIILLL